MRAPALTRQRLDALLQPNGRVVIVGAIQSEL